MSSSSTCGQTVFYAKTWYHVASALVFTVIGTVSVILGPLFLLDVLKRADGKPGTEAGIALSIIGIFMILVALLGWFNVYARRTPLLRICREGILINVIGVSSLDNVPLVPSIFRVAWLILSLQGFKKQIGFIPWESFEAAQATGLPMMRSLVIVAKIFYSNRGDQSLHLPLASSIIFREVEFRHSLDKVSTAIREFHSDLDARGALTSWNQ